MKKLAFILVLVCIVLVGYGTFRAFWWARHDVKTQDDFSKVVIYASSSFVDSFGPAADLKKLFEPICDCKVEFVDAGGGAMLLQRLQLQTTTRVDVVLGLDILMLKEASELIFWKKLKFNSPQMMPEVEPYRFAKFMAYSWAPISIIYNSSDKVMADWAAKQHNTFADLLQDWPDASLTMPDPRLSSLGKQFLFWIYSLNDKWAEIFPLVRGKIHSQSSGWSQSYGLFRNKQARSALSFTTSLVYHQEVDGDFDKAAVVVDGGHPVLVEYGAISPTCVTCDFGQQFLAFLASEEAQKLLMQKNYMYPVRPNLIEGTAYEKLPQLKLIGREKMDSFVRDWPEVMEQWAQQW